MRLGLYMVVIGVSMVGIIIGLFWLKDRFDNHRLAVVAYSEPIARLAVIGGAVTVIGLLLIVSSYF